MQRKKMKSILNVLNKAIQRETEAFNYYQKASQKAPFPETKSLLIQLAEEERKHRYFLFKETEKMKGLLTDDDRTAFIDKYSLQYPIPEKIEFGRFPSYPNLSLTSIVLPTEFTGGDVVDSIRIERVDADPLLGLVLFDVMGHGTEAMDIKALVKKVFGEFKETWISGEKPVDMESPHRVIEAFNREIFEKCNSCGHFVTAIYFVIDTVDGTMTYTSAGHEPPIIVRADGGIEELNETQILLGAEKNGVYEDVTARIEKGDIVAVFSDGITEIFNAEDQMFGKEGLTRSIVDARNRSVQDIISRIMVQLRHFTDEKPLADDIALAVIKIESSSTTGK